MLHRLCEPPSIPLSFSLATILPRRGTYHICFTWEHTGRPQASAHRLRLGLPGYLIPFATLAFAPQRQKWTREPPSPPVFLLISTHFTAPPGVLLSPTILEPCSLQSTSTGEPWISLHTYIAAYVPFMPSDSEQRLHPLYYRGCWHRVSRSFLSGLRQTQRY